MRRAPSSPHRTPYRLSGFHALDAERSPEWAVSWKTSLRSRRYVLHFIASPHPPPERLYITATRLSVCHTVSVSSPTSNPRKTTPHG